MTFFVRLVPCDKKSGPIMKLTLSMLLRGFNPFAAGGMQKCQKMKVCAAL